MKKIPVIALIFSLLFCGQHLFGQETVGKMEDIKKKRKKGSAEVTRQAGPAGESGSIIKKAAVNTQDILNIGDNTLASISFNDGGYVKMREGTRVEILSIDEIFLMDGHLFVNSKWHSKKGRRLQIKTKKVIAGTIGTEFYMFYSEASDSMVLAVFKGAIMLKSVDPAVNVQGTPLQVNAGQAVSVSQNQVSSFPQPIFNQVQTQANGWTSAMGPQSLLLPTWGTVLSAGAAVVGATSLMLYLRSERDAEDSDTATGTINVGIPPGN